jgi:hypothetical protein
MSLEATLATWELTKNEISSSEKFLLLSLARRAGEEHTCWPSIRRIVEDTGFNRKTVIDLRQSLIDKKLLTYTGRMVGRSGQIPEMKLLYVERWEQKRNSPRLRDQQNHSSKPSAKSGTGPKNEPVDNSPPKNVTGTKNGTGTSPNIGTGTSPEIGTLNNKLENVSRNKSFCASVQKKSKSEWKEENAKKHDFAEKKNIAAESQPQMQREAQHIAKSESYKREIVPASSIPGFNEMFANLKRKADDSINRRMQKIAHKASYQVSSTV